MCARGSDWALLGGPSTSPLDGSDAMPNVVPNAASRKPPQVVRAERFLWSALVLGVWYLGVEWKNLRALLPAMELFGYTVVALGVYVWLILRTSRGANWARFALLANCVLQLPGVAAWRETLDGSTLLFVLSATSLVLQTAAMYLLFTDPGRRWFHRSQPDAGAAV